jgi:DNA-binding IclR family transcriptional regulator
MADDGSTTQVKAAVRTLDLFEAFAAAGGPMTLSELSQRIRVPISSCHSLVRTLQRRGYVYVMEGRRLIYPTKRLAGIAVALGRYDPVLDRLAPIMARLAGRTGETVILGKLQGDIVVYLDVVLSPQTVRYAAAPGDTHPAHATALAKAILSLLPDDALDKTISGMSFRPYTGKSITDPAQFRAEIEAGRKEGHFATRGETIADMTGFATAHVIGDEAYALGVAGPSGRVEAASAGILDAMRDAAGEIGEMGRLSGA